MPEATGNAVPSKILSLTSIISGKRLKSNFFRRIFPPKKRFDIFYPPSFATKPKRGYMHNTYSP
ncbi:MAG: hypothetical protein K2N63_05085, partial [Lachnospiraceae bacterium]|nr:hypothetical protein [Lachnospiraceae bacterium]